MKIKNILRNESSFIFLNGIIYFLMHNLFILYKNAQHHLYQKTLLKLFV